METALLESTPLDEASFPSRFKTQGTAGSHGIFTHRSDTTLRPILPSCLKGQLPSRPWGTLLLSPKVTLGNPGVSPFSLSFSVSPMTQPCSGLSPVSPSSLLLDKKQLFGLGGVMTVPFPVGMWLLFSGPTLPSSPASPGQE